MPACAWLPNARSVGQFVSVLAIVLDAASSEHPIRFELVGSDEIRKCAIELLPVFVRQPAIEVRGMPLRRPAL